MNNLTPLALFLLLGTTVVSAEVPSLGPGASKDIPAFKLAFDNRFENSTKADFAKMLNKQKITVESWVAGINASGVEFLCLGERHDNKFRQRISEQILSRLDLDVLMLEANPSEVKKLQEAAGVGGPVNHLGADIAGVLRSAIKRNPALVLSGIEETKEQELARSNEPKQQRDSSIAENLMKSYAPGKRHAALYGALHCGRNSVSLSFQRPFYQHVSQVIDESKRVNVLVVVDSDWNNKFSVYMNMLDLNGESFVLPDTSLINPAVFNFNWDLKQYFDNYKTIVYLIE